MFIWTKHLFLHNTVRCQHGGRQLTKVKQDFLPVYGSTEDTSSLPNVHFCVHSFILHVIREIIKVLFMLPASGYLTRLFSAFTWSLKLHGNCQKETTHLKCWKYSIEDFLLYYGDIVDNGECLKIRKFELEDCKTVSSS